jgi:hypothetical protein
MTVKPKVHRIRILPGESEGTRVFGVSRDLLLHFSEKGFRWVFWSDPGCFQKYQDENYVTKVSCQVGNELVQTPGVLWVRFMKDHLTIKKSCALDWSEIQPPILHTLRSHYFPDVYELVEVDDRVDSARAAKPASTPAKR